MRLHPSMASPAVGSKRTSHPGTWTLLSCTEECSRVESKEHARQSGNEARTGLGCSVGLDKDEAEASPLETATSRTPAQGWAMREAWGAHRLARLTWIQIVDHMLAIHQTNSGMNPGKAWKRLDKEGMQNMLG
mmetsp:Transcript_24585/g.37357  ORF Transcript_24585/g.37357 Transcript_24585/m.37357 type:complete len:133 (-) Transcript_24585:412-810(-)